MHPLSSLRLGGDPLHRLDLQVSPELWQLRHDRRRDRGGDRNQANQLHAGADPDLTHLEVTSCSFFWPPISSSSRSVSSTAASSAARTGSERSATSSSSSGL